MKRILILAMFALSANFHAAAQTGTVSFLNNEKKADSIVTGSDFPVASHKAINSISKSKNGTLYNYAYKQTGYLADKTIKIRAFDVAVFNDKVFLIYIPFSEDGPEMLKKFTSIYGDNMQRPNGNADRYTWVKGKVQLVLDYRNPKSKYINLIDIDVMKRYNSGLGDLKSNSADTQDVAVTVPNPTNYFIAMQYKGLANCIYKVFITDSLIMCAKVNGYISVEPTFGLNKSVSKSQMHNPDAYVDKQTEASYSDILSDVNKFLKADRLNFVIRRKDIELVYNSAEKKWGMGYYPYGGRIFIKARQLDPSLSEFILVGDQDPINILRRLEPSLVK